MWTAENRAFVGDFGAGQALSDEQYALLAPLIPPAKWCIRQVGCDFSGSGALHGVPVRAGEVAMTLRVRALREEEGHRLARMTRSQKLGAGLVRRAQIIQHAVDGLSAPGIAAKMGLCDATVRFWLK